MRLASLMILISMLSAQAVADEPKRQVLSATCEDIRRAVALFPSVWAAEKAARAAGASDRQIAEARKCLSR